VSSRSVERATGGFTRSENSLNQHLKLKHPEFWTKMKEIVAESSGRKSSVEGSGDRSALEDEAKSVESGPGSLTPASVDNKNEKNSDI